MDALLEPTFFGALPDEPTLRNELARTIKEEHSTEDFLDRLRMFSQEQMFLIGARILSGTVSVLVNGRTVAERAAGTHVGEMSLIDPTAWRSV